MVVTQGPWPTKDNISPQSLFCPLCVMKLRIFQIFRKIHDYTVYYVIPIPGAGAAKVLIFLQLRLLVFTE